MANQNVMANQIANVALALIVLLAMFFLTQMLIAVVADPDIALAQMAMYQSMFEKFIVGIVFIVGCGLLALIAVFRSKSEAAQRYSDNNRHDSMIIDSSAAQQRLSRPGGQGERLLCRD